MEKQIKINTGKSLSKAIKAIVNESLKSALHQNAVDEKEVQSKLMGEEDDDLFGGDDKSSDTGEEKKDSSSKTMDSEKEKLQKGEIEPKDIIEKLNAIRAGKSFKDEAIANKMNEYVESLSKAEKVALLAFLKGLSQIVTGEVDAETATDPADPDPDVKMKKGAGEPEKKSLKPNVIKAPEKEKSEKKPSSEDTSGPVPITPKK
jgi:hypothetical protein